MEPLPPRIPYLSEERQEILAETLAGIRLADPGFDQAAILEGVRTEFLRRRGEGKVTLDLEGVRLVWAVHSAAGDHLTALIAALDDAGRPITECGTLSRPPGTLSQPATLAPSECLVCGGPLQSPLLAACPHCAQPLPSPFPGWSVGGITDGVDWNVLQQWWIEIEAGAALAAIRAADPGFDEAVFKQQARTEFEVVKNALSDWTADQLGTYASVEVARSWRETVALQRQNQVRTLYRGLQVHDVRVAWASTGLDGDHVTLAIEASATTKGISVTTGGEVFGDSQPQRLVEYWSLDRTQGTRTVPPQGSCPHCGAPEAKPRTVSCPYCQGLLAAPLQGWLVTRIDDHPAWADSHGGHPETRPAEPEAGEHDRLPPPSRPNPDPASDLLDVIQIWDRL